MSRYYDPTLDIPEISEVQIPRISKRGRGVFNPEIKNRTFDGILNFEPQHERPVSSRVRRILNFEPQHERPVSSRVRRILNPDGRTLEGILHFNGSGFDGYHRIYNRPHYDNMWDMFRNFRFPNAHIELDDDNNSELDNNDHINNEIFDPNFGIPSFDYDIEFQEKIKESIKDVKYNDIKEKNMNTKCPVCTDDFDETYDTVTLPCDHNYCKDCIHTWVKSRADCPLCRKNIIIE